MPQFVRSMGRIWPDGEFVLWSEVAKEIIDPEQAIPLGLSELSNSHKDIEMEERTRRGLGGITMYGQRMVKNAAYLLQQKYGARQLTFLTLTLPGTPDETFEVSKEWSRITRNFYQKLKRRLVGEGLSPAVVGVTEIQPKRFLRTGGMPLHLHIVFQGANRDNEWVFRPDDFKNMWRETVMAVFPGMEKHSFASATNTQRVRDSAAGYLGKYMSKGEKDISMVIEKSPGVVDALPSAWYNLSKEARDAVRSYTRYGPEVGDMLEEWRSFGFGGMNPFRFIALGQIKNPEGDVLATFRFGHLEGWAKKMAGLPLTKYEINGI